MPPSRLFRPLGGAALLGRGVRLGLVLGLELGLSLTPAAATPTSSATGQAAAQVIAPLAVTREADLDFGTLASAAGTAGQVTVVPLTGSVSYAGGTSGICAASCPPPRAARFAVQGEPLRSYRVSLPARLTIGLVAGGGGTAVIVDSLVAATRSNPADAAGTLGNDGRDAFEIGGTLHLPADASPGRYSTQVPVIVNYL